MSSESDDPEAGEILDDVSDDEDIAVPKQPAKSNALETVDEPKASKRRMPMPVIRESTSPKQARLNSSRRIDVCTFCGREGHLEDRCYDKRPCCHCGRTGHNQNTCQQGRHICTFCGRIGHRVDRCIARMQEASCKSSSGQLRLTEANASRASASTMDSAVQSAKKHGSSNASVHVSPFSFDERGSSQRERILELEMSFLREKTRILEERNRELEDLRRTHKSASDAMMLELRSELAAEKSKNVALDVQLEVLQKEVEELKSRGHRCSECRTVQTTQCRVTRWGAKVKDEVPDG